MIGVLACSILLADSPADAKRPKLQYEAEGIAIPAATADEPRVKKFGPDSVLAAAKYLDDGARSWVEGRSCVACHTSGAYLAERPALSRWLGPPPALTRDDFAADVPEKIPPPPNPAKRTKYEGLSIGPVWRTLGLAEWDKHTSGKLSPATERSLQDMLNRQGPDGFWPTFRELEIPYITTDFELSVQAAKALAAAPGWLANLTDPELRGRVDRLKAAFRRHRPRNDFERALQLELARALPDVVSAADRQAAVAMLWSKQRSDGGWSLRMMSGEGDWRDDVPESVRRLARVRPQESDPYMTAFALLALRGEGVPATDPRLRRGIAWLKAEQRVSGRWWMRSLYKDNYRYITYIATAKALSALAACGELPATVFAAAP